MPAEEHREVLEQCWRKVEAEEHRLVLLPVIITLGTPMLVVFVWHRFSGTQGLDEATAWVVVGGMVVAGAIGCWAIFLISARYMRPHLLAELRARGLCQGCGYDLQEKATVCPECGERATWPDWSSGTPP